jgi:2-hydroxychromene-2-carboxylate isomerase
LITQGSPWAYLAFSQLERLQRDAGPGLKIELKPFLLGALFKAIGTPVVPMNSLSEAKRQYNAQDLMDWSAYWDGCNAKEYPPIEGPHLRWPDEFPIRSVTALRVAIIEPKTVPAIYRAAWRDNQRISDDKVLANVLSANGFNGSQLVLAATTGSKAETVKEKLRANTEEAVKTGLCGVSAGFAHELTEHLSMLATDLLLRCPFPGPVLPNGQHSRVGRRSSEPRSRPGFGLEVGDHLETGASNSRQSLTVSRYAQAREEQPQGFP